MGPSARSGLPALIPRKKKTAYSKLTQPDQFLTQTMSYNSRGHQLVLVITDLNMLANYNWK